MPLMSQPSSAAKTSLAYITIGALTVVWTSVWWWYLHNTAEAHLASTWYVCYGLMATGFVVLLIGLAVGQIGRQARHAELPPPEATRQEAQIDQNAATRPVVAAPTAAPVAAGQPGAVPATPRTAAAPVNAPAPVTMPAPRV